MVSINIYGASEPAAVSSKKGSKSKEAVMAATRAAFQQTGPFGKDGITDSEDEDEDEDAEDEDEDEDEGEDDDESNDDEDEDEVDEDDDESSEADADSGLLFYTKTSCILILACRVDE